MATQSGERLGWRLDRLGRDLEKRARRIDYEPDDSRTGVDNRESRTQIAFDSVEAETCSQVQCGNHLPAHEYDSFDGGMSIRNRRDVVDQLDLLHKATAHAVRRAREFKKYKWFHLFNPLVGQGQYRER